MKKSFNAICIVLSVLMLLTACSSESGVSDSTGSQKQSSSVSAPVTPTFGNDDLFTESVEDGTIVFDGDVSVSGDGLSSKGSAATVSKEGTYRVSGKSSDGQIIVDCSDKDDVVLIFDNLSLHCENAPAVYCLEADTLTISLPKGSSSYVSDGASRPDKNSPDAAIYSKGDLYFNGTGSLSVSGNANNAVESRDSLTILQCALSVDAADDGILGKDSLEIGADASVTVKCGGDGLRSTNDEDEGRGYIYFGSCTADIDSGADAVQAAVSVTVDEGASVNILSGGGAPNGTSDDSSGFGGFGGFGERNDFAGSSSSADSSSMKGLKASSVLYIKGGTVAADCADDAVHCNGNIIISGGVLNLASGDDGIHADSELAISGGGVNISQSYEGLEANVITVSGGNIQACASDDGINVAGGNDSSSTGGMWGHDMFANDESCLLSVSGGKLSINASGDGVDSNGSIKMSGGELLVSGPTNSGNGFLDFAGDFEITGGTLLALGSSGMAQTVNAGTQASVAVSINGTVPSGSVLTLKTSDGSEIVTYTSPKNYQCFVASSPLMSEGDSVDIYIDGELLGSLSASVNISSGGSGMGDPGGGHGHGGHGPGGGRP